MLGIVGNLSISLAYSWRPMISSFIAWFDLTKAIAIAGLCIALKAYPVVPGSHALLTSTGLAAGLGSAGIALESTK